ncbi:MAG: 50S ribosomal protein L5 [Candidatus Pacearchaeota archaeon]
MSEQKAKNVMEQPHIDKVVLTVGGTGEDLEKGIKLLKVIANRTPAEQITQKRISALGVRPGLKVGGVVTVRQGKHELLQRLLEAVDKTLKAKQVSENSFSFGISEYIEIPGVEYQRDIGIRGLEVTVTFKKPGRRVKLKKPKKGKLPRKQRVSKEEIIKFMEYNFDVNFK